MWLVSLLKVNLLTVISSNRGFNLPDFVDTAFKKLTSDIEILSDVTIGGSKDICFYLFLVRSDRFF
jgi:hypothetical protein